MQWYVDVLKKYVVFSGRARRKEFWMFFLVNAVISIVLAVVDNLLDTTNDQGSGLLGSIYWLATVLPFVAATVRRLHDTDRSGWWALLWALPILGWIPLIVFLAMEGNPGDNQHGPDPKAHERGAAAFPGGEPGYPQV